MVDAFVRPLRFIYRRYDENQYNADISGVPGAGKTATVHAVVRELKRMAEQNVRS